MDKKNNQVTHPPFMNLVPHQFHHTYSTYIWDISLLYPIFINSLTTLSSSLTHTPLPPRASIFSFMMHYCTPLSLATWRWEWHSWWTTWLPSQNQQRMKRRGRLGWRGNSMYVCGCMCIQYVCMRASVHVMHVVPISRSPQRSWWGLVLAKTRPVQWVTLHNI